jgi:hypothetical protein
MSSGAALQVSEMNRTADTEQIARVTEAGKSLKSSRSPALVAWLPLAFLLSAVALLHVRLPRWELMWALAFSIFFGLKWVTWLRARTQVPHARWRAAAYLLAWPGMDAASFLDETKRPQVPHFADWFLAFFKTVIGVCLLWFVARNVPSQALLRGWVGMLGLIFLLHFGVFHILALFWRSCGVQATPIMRAPFRARSLGEFWGKRWNLGFRELGHDLIFVPLHKHLSAGFASLAVFVVSGLIHDLVISVPARAGFGLPTAYFTFQGLGALVERAPFGRQIGLGKGLPGFLFLLVVTTAPIFWLFHPAFVLHVIIPFMQEVRAL